MKRLSILTLLSAPFATEAFATDIPYSNKGYIDLAGGDTFAAIELDQFCGITGRTLDECRNALGGQGNLRAEAARKCVQQTIMQGLPIGGKLDHTRATDFAGAPHFDNRKTGGVADSAKSHAHFWTDGDREQAYYALRRQLVAEAQARKSGRETTSTADSSSSVKGSAQLGDPMGVVKVGLEGGGGHGSQSSSTTQSTMLTKEELAAIDKEAEKARQNPAIVPGMKPSGVCAASSKRCTDPSGRTFTNPNYDAKEAEKEKREEEAKEGKKTSSTTPPKSEDDKVSEIPTVIAPVDQGTWAGGPEKNAPDTAIATPVMDKDALPATFMEECMVRETRKLENFAGSVTVDHDSTKSEDKAQRAKEALEKGYCMESFYGREECRKIRFKQDSVVAIDVEQERSDNYNSAMSEYQKTGVCDSNVLGSEFCENATKKWDSTPVPVEPVFKGTNRPSLVAPELDRRKLEGDSLLPGLKDFKPRPTSGSIHTVPTFP
jgi:hypothetical protein